MQHIPKEKERGKTSSPLKEEGPYCCSIRKILLLQPMRRKKNKILVKKTRSFPSRSEREKLDYHEGKRERTERGLTLDVKQSFFNKGEGAPRGTCCVVQTEKGESQGLATQ